jgi:GTP-binding protein
MKIKSAVFKLSAIDLSACPATSLREFAFIGRSNVGKSSLINLLCEQRDLAKVSSTPGKTRLINFFLINDRWHLVDLPGYGFAKRSKTEADSWQEMIFAYLRRRARLRRVLLLIDARRGVMDSDRQVMTLLDQAAVSYGLVLTKADELNPSGHGAARAAAGQEAAKHTAALTEIQLTSAVTRDGIPELRTHLAALI